jgi:multicomponent Na+:H+ antiporter subunit E
VNNTKHAVYLGLFLYALWFLLSGYSGMLLSLLGLLSTAFTVVIAMRMEIVDRESHPILLKPSIINFWIWLAGEVVKSNLAVARCILSPDLPISPTVIRIRSTQRSELGRVTFANCITFVPGTVTLHTQGEYLSVHALTRDLADDLLRGEMDRRVTRVERTL